MAPSLVLAVLGRYTPSTWTCMSPTEEVALIPLSEHDIECSTVVQSISMTLRNKVQTVFRVQNPYLWGSYSLKKEEYLNDGFGDVTERKLIHATAEENVLSICQNNLDWRRAKRTRYGRGVSFSPCADYANTYCNEKCGQKRALIVARVLVRMETRGGYGTKMPPPLLLTTPQLENLVKLL